MYKASKGVLGETSCEHSMTGVAPTPQLKPLDSKRMLTDTHRYRRLLLHVFQAPQDLASSLFLLPPVHTSYLHCARLHGSHRDRRKWRSIMRDLQRVLAAWGRGQKCLFGKVMSLCNCQGLVRVGIQMAEREVGRSSCKRPLQWKQVPCEVVQPLKEKKTPQTFDVAELLKKRLIWSEENDICSCVM